MITRRKRFIAAIGIVTIAGFQIAGSLKAERLEDELKRKMSTEGLAIADLENQGPPQKLTITKFGTYHPIYVPFPFSFVAARFSPSGTVIAGIDFDRKLRVVDIEGTEINSLTGRVLNPSSFALSVDAKKLAFCGTYTPLEPHSPGAAWLRSSRITGVQFGSIDAGTTTTLVRFDREDDRFECGDMSWSPTGEQMVYDLKGKVILFDFTKGVSRLLTAGQLPSWSPDGKWIAYRDEKRRLRLIAPNGGNRRSLSPGSEVVGGLRWSPDSSYLAFGEKHLSPPYIASRLIVLRLTDEAMLSVRESVNPEIGRDQGWIYYKALKRR